MMPTYDYVCKACGKEFTIQQSKTAKGEAIVCPFCKDSLIEIKETGPSQRNHESSNCGKASSWRGG